MAQHTETEKARMIQIDQQLETLKAERAAIQAQAEAAIAPITAEITHLWNERKALQNAPLERQLWEHRQRVTENMQNLTDMRRYEREAQVPVAPPKHPLEQWLEKNRHRFNELDRKSAGGNLAVMPLTDEELAFVREYNQKLRSWRTGAYRLEDAKQASAAFVNERQAEHAQITAAIAADHAEGRRLLQENFQRQLGRD